MDVEPRADAAATAESFTIAYVPGVTLSKWARIWAERVPEVPLRLLGVTEPEQTAVLHEGRAQMSFVRLPVDRGGLSVIPLYTELPVVVAPKEHAVALFEEVAMNDLAGEQLHEAATESVQETLELVAAGVGLVIVPQSLARLHSRRDLVYRPVTDHDPTQIGLAWVAERSTEHIEEFIGIVRGRTVNSSRSATETQPAKTPRADRRKPATRNTRARRRKR